MWISIPRQRFITRLPTSGRARCSVIVDMRSACRFRRAFSAATSSRGSREENWDAEEPLSGYDPATNGYLPVGIGDTLGSRYKTVRKIGWGVYSTVWIAEDTR